MFLRTIVFRYDNAVIFTKESQRALIARFGEIISTIPWCQIQLT